MENIYFCRNLPLCSRALIGPSLINSDDDATELRVQTSQSNLTFDTIVFNHLIKQRFQFNPDIELWKCSSMMHAVRP